MCALNTQPFISQVSDFTKYMHNSMWVTMTHKKYMRYDPYPQQHYKEALQSHRGQDIHEMHYKEIMSDEISIKGKKCRAGTKVF